MILFPHNSFFDRFFTCGGAAINRLKVEASVTTVIVPFCQMCLISLYGKAKLLGSLKKITVKIKITVRHQIAFNLCLLTCKKRGKVMPIFSDRLYIQMPN